MPIGIKSPAIEIDGQMYERQFFDTGVYDIVVTDSQTVPSFAVVLVALRGSAGGGGGSKTNYLNNGKYGSSGLLIEDTITLNPDTTYVRGRRGSGGLRDDSTSTVSFGETGGSSTSSTFGSLTAGVRLGGDGGTFNISYPRVAPAITNPDASDAGRGGSGGDADNVNFGLRNGQVGKYGRLFLHPLD